MSAGDEQASAHGWTTLRTYRTQPALILGSVLLLIAVLIAVLIGRDELAAGRGVVDTLSVLAVAVAVVWTVLLRPGVRLTSEGVVLLNLVTDVVVPFDRLRAVEHRWSLELVDGGGRTHASWAVPVKRYLRPARRSDGFAEATAAGRGGKEGTHAVAVATDIERAWQRWRLAGRPGEDTGAAASRESVRPRPAWPALVPLAVSLVLAVLSALS